MMNCNLNGKEISSDLLTDLVKRCRTYDEWSASGKACDLFESCLNKLKDTPTSHSLTPLGMVFDELLDETLLWPPELRELINKMILTSMKIANSAYRDPLYYCFSLGFCSIRDLVTTEAISAITHPFKKNPGHPNRDHVCHVFAVHWILSKLILPDIKGNERIFVNQLKNESLLSGFIKKLELTPSVIWAAVQRAIPIMSLCHDLAYPLEIAGWVSDNPGIKALVQCCGISSNDNHEKYIEVVKKVFRKNIYPSFLENKNRDLADIGEDLTKLEDWFIKGIEDRKNDDKNTSTPDHGQKAAMLLLASFTEPEFWNTFDRLDQLALLLSCLAIFNHCNFTKDRGERKRPGKEGEYSPDDMWIDDPIGVTLALADLLAEGPRTTWFLKYEPEIVEGREWETKIRIYHALCIPNCIIKMNGKKISFMYYSNNNKYPKKDEMHPIPKNFNDYEERCFNTETAIKGKKNEKTNPASYPRMETCKALAKLIWKDYDFFMDYKIL